MKNGFRIVLVSAIVISELLGMAHAEKHKAFGDYTTYITTDDYGVVYKQANVKLNGMLAEVVFNARSNSDKVFAFVNKQKVQLIVDGTIMDNELDKNEVIMVKSAKDIAVIHGGRTYMISTKGSGASMIYLTDFPKIKNILKDQTLSTNSSTKCVNDVTMAEWTALGEHEKGKIVMSSERLRILQINLQESASCEEKKGNNDSAGLLRLVVAKLKDTGVEKWFTEHEGRKDEVLAEGKHNQLCQGLQSNYEEASGSFKGYDAAIKDQFGSFNEFKEQTPWLVDGYMTLYETMVHASRQLSQNNCVVTDDRLRVR